MKKRSGANKSKRVEGGVSPSKVLDRIRNNALATTEGSIPIELLKDSIWIVDRGLEKRVWKLLEEDLPEESYEAIVYAMKLAASRLTLMGTSVSQAGEEIEEEQPMVIIPFAILFSAAFTAGDAAPFPIALPDSIGHAVESGLMHAALGMSDDITVFFDPRLYQPQHPEWLQPSATRRYLQSIAEHVVDPTLSVVPLSSDYKGRPETHLLPDEMNLCQRLICGAIISPINGEGRTMGEAGKLLFGDRGDEPGVNEEKFQELNELIEDELEGRCLLTEAKVLINPTPIELWDVPRFVFQVQRTVSIGLAIEMAVEGLRDTAPDVELKSALYVSVHGAEETLEEFRFAAYLVDEKGSEEEAPFFTYVWEIAFEVESPEDIDEASADIAAQLNASVNNMEGLQPDSRCDLCGARLFFGAGDSLHHELVDPDECPPPYEN